MATAPQPPSPPIPPKPASHLLAIVLLILALIVVTSVAAIWMGARYLSRAVRVQVEEGAGGKKSVSVRTPLGTFGVRKDEDVDESKLGLPIYPGAVQVKGENSASVSLDLPGAQNFRIVAAKFDTQDPADKVRDFYKQRLGGDVTKYTERNSEGKTVFEIKHNDQEKVAAIFTHGTGTRIELVRIAHGRNEAN